jgi:hypothetical protein
MDNAKSAGFLSKIPGYLTPGTAGIFKRKPSWVFRPSKVLREGLYQNSSPP